MRWCFPVVLFFALVCSVRPDEELPEPTLRIMARSTVYNVGETKAIFCKGQNLVEPIQWYSPSGKLVEERSTKNSRVFVERKTEDNGVLVPLIIHRIKISDGGNWTCKAGNLSETKEFIVGEKVNITDRNVTLEGEEGKSVKLTCEANGYPLPVVVWYKDKHQIRDKEDTKKYVIKADNSLEIKKLNHADVGLYVCKVRQKALSHYTEKTVHLSVQHKPILYNSDTQMIYTNTKYKTEEVYAILNDTKNVTCSAIANPPPTYRWFRRLDSSYDEAILEPDTVITSEDGTSSVLILRIRDETYYGEYKCSATNSKGAESIIFHVNPGSKPLPPDTVQLTAANTTNLTFNVTCSSCNFASPDEVPESPDPKNLTVIGYIFQLTPSKQGYPADWDGAPEFRVDIETANNTLFTLGPLSNSTTFHVRVRTRNAAGNSEWLEAGYAATTDDAIRLSASLLLITVTICMRMFGHF
ncbi:neural cell adhesion molecule 2 [Spodoptera frugiperda]|uniref:Neural cell adhesion molecule 2 n=1 Tax=Spodoptera frugiperda TaxID=7108 RepID=A0A9R0CY72_SPOFR|nr:neural cell adhesion molecule 2 [Spodoptera frugiperda]